MPYEYVHRRRVELADTDLGGVMHFSNYLRFMESAEHAFFRSLGLSQAPGPAQVFWPRGRVACEYRAPVRFEDELSIRLLVRARGSRSIDYDFLFHRAGDERGKPLAHGSMTAVCTAWDAAAGRFRAMRLPPEVAARIEAAPPEQLPPPLAGAPSRTAEAAS